MDLLPSTAAHASLVAEWPTHADEVVRWCGRREFPVTARTVAAWQEDDDVRAHVLVEDGTVLGYGEVWLDDEEDEAELARIIVAPGARGRGIGRILVRKLLGRAFAAGFRDVFLRVRPDNETALACYRGAGFVTVDAGLAASWNAAQPVDYVWLRNPTALSSH